MKLNDIGIKHGTDKSTLYHGYLDFYQRHLPKKPKRVLEIGVLKGSSLKMWRDYYPKAEVVGIDINEPIEIEGVTVLKLDATDFHDTRALGMFDIIIDDGSHMTGDQQKSMYLLSDKLSPGGAYIIEDIHTSFNPDYVNTEPTTVEVLEQLKANGTNVAFWSRTDDKTDSYTAIIKR